jgi:GT2 family glycosyltransferase
MNSNTNKAFCIAIPTVNRKDLLMDALEWYTQNMPNTEILILDNGRQDIPELTKKVIIDIPEKNLGVAYSWNFLIWKANKRGYSHVLVLNDDVILQRSEAEIYALIQKEDNQTFHRPKAFYNWSAYIISQDIFSKVGMFDTAFKKAFFEDNDYEYRMKLAGVNLKYQDDLNPQVYRNSQTIEKDPLLGGYLENRELYIKKWGGIPNEETYKTPYNA